MGEELIAVLFPPIVLVPVLLPLITKIDTAFHKKKHKTLSFSLYSLRASNGKLYIGGMLHLFLKH